MRSATRCRGLAKSGILGVMKFVCDAPDGKTWFRIESEAEAILESDVMRHAVAKYFCQEREQAVAAYEPPPGGSLFEQEIGLEPHVQRTMARFLTLRDADGNGLATAMLPPDGAAPASFRPIIVGVANADPYPAHGEAIRALADHAGMKLDRDRCFPYRRG